VPDRPLGSAPSLETKRPADALRTQPAKLKSRVETEIREAA
jgi:hypothetical protein